MGKIARYLNQLTTGDVFDAPEVLETYSTDRSVLKIRPKLVALPESTEDIRKLMRFSSQLFNKGIKLPVTVRGSGLDEMGADLGNGLVISTEKLNKLLEADKRERLVRVQAGITLRELNTALSVNGLTIPIEGHENETIGGLISNCPADGFSGKYGGIFNFVERMEVVLPNGDILQTGSISRRTAMRRANDKTSEGKIYSKILQLLKKEEDLIRGLKTSPRSLIGYRNITKVANKSSFDLLPIFFGAEGTLGVITEVILRATPVPKDLKRVAAAFDEYADAEKFLSLARSLKPIMLDIYDLRAIKLTEDGGKKANEITKKMSDGFVVFMKFDKKGKGKIKKLTHLSKKLPKSAKVVTETSKTAKVLDDLENTLTSFVNRNKMGDSTPLMIGFSLPVKNVGELANDLKVLKKSLKLDLVLYGSYAANNYNLTPRFDLSDTEFSKEATNFLRVSAYVINRQGGVVTGALPEGRIKALVVDGEMPEAEKALYAAIKNIFDRQGILNPGVKTDVDARFTVRHFRSL